MTSRTSAALVLGIALVLLSCNGDNQGSGGTAAIPVNPLREAYFGDFHIHTPISLDSYLVWNTNTLDHAYRYAKGEPVTLGGNDNVVHKLKAPLDFAGISDHAEWFGEVDLCLDQSSTVYEAPMCQLMRQNRVEAFYILGALATMDPPQRARFCEIEDCMERARVIWRETQDMARMHNAPGKFTTFIAYEYTRMIHDGGMMHRNVIFGTDSVPEDAMSSIDLPSAEGLLEWLSGSCTGDCRSLSIPHNPNYSWGQMLDPWLDSSGQPHTAENLALRAATEPLIEIFQTKGSSECHPGLGTDDEFCDELVYAPCTEENNGHHCVEETSYIRNALKNGLIMADRYGVNPFKYGFIGSTDTHNGIPGATEEDQYEGHHGVTDLTPAKRLGLEEGGVQGFTENPVNNPGGLAGVWAESNTRESIFAALKRKETFATSGPRIRVRFFGSFDYAPDLHLEEDMLKQAYAQGVPMGSDLPAGQEGQAPTFLVWAAKDPNSANLQRLQIIKGWSNGSETFEKIYDVVCSDALSPDPVTGRCPDNGAGVDLSDCSYAADLGAAELSTVWIDPDFDPNLRAFYYVRVLENPTCRWSTYDALRLHHEDPDNFPEPPLLEGTSPTIHECAWASPIWYSPVGH